MHRRKFLHIASSITAALGLPSGRVLHAGETQATSHHAWDGFLAAGQFIPAKMPLTAERVVLPRPDSETSARAYHRNAHAGVPYELPLVIQGGAWPFVYELLAGPAGATLGRNFGDPGYGILRWTPVTNGNFSFSVRVTDQDGASVLLNWSGATAPGWLTFVDAVNGSDSTGNGSIASPWRSLQHAYGATRDGRGLCLRAGDYQAPNEAMNISVSGGTGAGMVGSLFGFPGEPVRIDCSTLQAPNFAWYNSSDTFVSHLALSGGPVGQANPRYFVSLKTNHRCYQYRLSFDSPSLGTASNGGDDNNSCLFLGASGAIREYVAQVFCTFRRLHYTNNGFSGIDTYQTRYLVVADNVYDTPAASSSRYALWIKGWEQEDVSVRGNRWTQPWGSSLIEVTMSAGAGTFSARRMEFCYNTLVASSDALTLGASPSGPARGPIWVYRNTVVGRVIIARRNWPLEIHFENDVIVHDIETFGGTVSGKLLMSDPNAPEGRYYDPSLRPAITLTMANMQCHGHSSSGILDANHRLQGNWRSSYGGTHGAEIIRPDRVFASGFE